MNLWDELFPSAETTEACERLEMRLLRKHGRPLLLAPNEPKMAIECLELYPAQTNRARFAKGLLRWLWRTGLFVKTEPVQLSISRSAPFVRFLSSSANMQTGGVPPPGILTGNPAGGTQRFIILLFDAIDQPTAIVKAGVSPASRELIAKEKTFLSNAPSDIRGIPRIRGSFESASVAAFAMEFFQGKSPRLEDQNSVASLLTSWIRPEVKISLGEFPEWRAFASKFPQQGAPQNSRHSINAVIQHGDFAPWNIKVSGDGSWTVLDWERGRLNGIPGWDWFHYVIQTNILVRKLNTDDLVKAVELLLSSTAFKAYIEKAGIAGIARPLLLAYLLNIVEEVKPAEGLEENRALFEALKNASGP